MNSRETLFELLSISPPGWGGVLLTGAYWTLIISAGAYAIGVTIGIIGALGKLTNNPLLVYPLGLYTTLVRSIPTLILIIGLYYTGTESMNNLLASFGLPTIEINGLFAAVAVLGFVKGAYAIEVFRGAFLAIPVGQIEAAKAFGMSPSLRFRRITISALIPNALPGLANLWMTALKDSALIAIIGYQELTLAAKNAAGITKHFFLFFMAAALIYLVISVISEALFNRIEKHYRRGEPGI